MTKYCTNKEIHKLVKEKVSKGWYFKKGKKHGVLIAPIGKKLIIPTSPSDYRAYYNLRSTIRSLTAHTKD